MNIGDRVRYQGAGQIETIEGIIERFYAGEKNCIDPETGEKYNTETSACVRVDMDTLVGHWPYSDANTFAPDCSEITVVT